MGAIAPGVLFQLPGGSHPCTATINAVSAWRPSPWRVSDLPAVSWRDGIQEIEQRASMPDRLQLRVVFAAYLGSASMIGARAMLADICAALGSDRRCGGLALWTSLEKTSLGLEVAGDIITGCRVGVLVTYEQRYGEPTQPDDYTLTADGEIITAEGETLTW